MDGPAEALVALWDRIADAVPALDTDDRVRPTGCPGTDVTGLTAHLAGAHWAGPERVRQALAAARDGAVRRVGSRPSGDRVLGADCLDLWVHAHDLDTATRAPLDLVRADAVALEACRLVVDLAPRLLRLPGDPGTPAGALHVVVRRPGQDGTALVRTLGVGGGCRADGAPSTARPGARPAVLDEGAVPTGATSTLEIDPDALLLLLTGRRSAATLRAEGAADWSGGPAAAFVAHARLPGALGSSPPTPCP
jgi:hypothetical protein